MKKFICLILVLSLLFSSVGAVEVYEVEADTELLEPVSKPKYQTMVSLVGSGASTYGTVTNPGYSDNDFLWLIYDTTYDIWFDFYTFWNNYTQKFDSFVTRFGALAANVQLIQSEVDLISTKIPDVLTKLEGIDDSVDQVSEYINILMGYVSDVESAVVAVNSSLVAYLDSSSPLYGLLYRFSVLPAGVYLGAYGSEFTAGEPIGLGDVIASGIRGIANSFRAWSGWTVLGSSGDETVLSSDWSFSQLVNNGFLGLRSLMTVPSGSSYLGSSGSMVTSSSDLDIAEILKEGFGGIYSLSYVNKPNYVAPDGTVKKSSGKLTLDNMFRDFALGVRSLIAGSEADNIYSGTSINNENLSSSFDATGLGPMLHTWLGDIQNDLGVLSYVFASPQDLELKKESEGNMDAVGETILSSDSKSSVKVNDITSISSASDSIQELGETGVTPGQAFEQLLDNDDLFKFFSEETYHDLNSSVSTYSRDPSQQIVTSYYQDSRLEFFELIGKGGES